MFLLAASADAGFFSTADIPDNTPSTGCSGCACTSKVLRSRSSRAFVAFHTANDPTSFISVMRTGMVLSTAGTYTSACVPI